MKRLIISAITETIKSILFIAVCALFFSAILLFLNKTEAKAAELEPAPGEVWEELGTYTITHYCPCKKCCGKSDGITASGTQATEGTTVAMKGLEFGTVVYIDGYGYRTVEDRGVGKNWVDVFMDDHQACLNAGLVHRKVWVVRKENTNDQ